MFLSCCLLVDHPGWPGGLRSGESRFPGDVVSQIHDWTEFLVSRSDTYIVTEKCHKMTQYSLSSESDKFVLRKRILIPGILH